MEIISKEMATRNQELVTGLGAFITGGMINTFLPGSMAIAYTMYFASGVAFSLYFDKYKSQQWDKLFMATGLKVAEGDIIKVPKLQEKTKTNNGYMLRFNVLEGFSLTAFKLRQEAIENYLGKKVEITYNNKNFFIEVFENELKKYYPYKEPVQQKMNGVYFPVGYSINGLEWLTLSSENPQNPHMLIAGTTGSGKSVTLRSIITSVILNAQNYNSMIRLHLVDFKYGAEFSIFKRCKYVASFSRTDSECIEMLREMGNEINNRYILFGNNGVANIEDYNKKASKKIPYELIFIDEFACLIGSKNKEAIEILIDVAQRARNCGVFLVVSTQRPDSKVVDGRIKQCFTSIIGLKCLDDNNSSIVIDRAGLEDLRGSGHCIVKDYEGKEREIQGMMLSTDQAKKLIEHTYKQEEVYKAKSKKLTKDEIAKMMTEEDKKGVSEDFSFWEVIENEKECRKG